MPGWQHFYETHQSPTFKLVSIAMEHTGPEAARPFVEKAGATFPTLVDEHALTSKHFGFKAVPNGVLLAGDGTIHYAKYGGFSINNPDDVEAVERFIKGEAPGPSPSGELPYRLGNTEQELVETRLRLGRLLDSIGRRDEAVAEWKAALHLDPENLVIRKQIWAACYPEKFYPTIDFDWQKDQLTRERQEEMAAGICGPDGCPLPRMLSTSESRHVEGDS